MWFLKNQLQQELWIIKKNKKTYVKVNICIAIYSRINQRLIEEKETNDRKLNNAKNEMSLE